MLLWPKKSCDIKIICTLGLVRPKTTIQIFIHLNSIDKLKDFIFLRLKLNFSLTEEIEPYASMLYLNLTKDFMVQEYIVILSCTLEYY